jgi:hypothetical protein
MGRGGDRRDDEPQGRAPGPAARAGAALLFHGLEAGSATAIALVAALPAVVAALLAPALLTTAPTADLLAGVAEARALAHGGSGLVAASSPFDLSLLLAADFFFEAPGRIHLGAKAFAALMAAAAMGVFAAVRFPVLQAALLAAGTAAFAAAPLSGAHERALAFLAAAAVGFLCAPARGAHGRALAEGVLGGLLLFVLWMSDPALALVGVLALSASPFLTGARGLFRYGAALALLAGLAALSELAAPGLLIARAETAAATLAAAAAKAPAAGAFDIAAIASAALVALLVSAVFGGEASRRNTATAFAFLAFGWAAAIAVGASPAILFLVAAAIAVFSTGSPFHDGVSDAHDRASIAVSGGAGVAALGLAVALVLQSADQFVRQAEAARAAPLTVVSAFAVVQPPELTLERWMKEGRFRSAEARALFPITPADQTAMLLDAAEKARALRQAGFETAILARGDITCVIAGRRDCASDGRAAAARAQIVLVPRFDLDAAGTETAGRAEALLYTEFRRLNETPQWDVWIRRGVALPESLSLSLAPQAPAP